MFKKLLADTKQMQHSGRPLSPLRSTTPSRYPADLMATRKDQLIRSPLRDYDSKVSNQYLSNHLQRRCTSPIRSPSPLRRKNTQPVPNSYSPLRTQGYEVAGNQQKFNRMPESCGAPEAYGEQSQGKENMKNNYQLFTMLVKDQNIKSETSNLRPNKQKSVLTFTEILKKQHSLGERPFKENQEQVACDTTEKKEEEKRSLTTMDFSSGKKLSFKDSLKGGVAESLKPSLTLEKKTDLNDSIGSISRGDRVNESVIENSIMDLNMDPCFDM